MTSSSGNPIPFVAAAQDARADFQKYFLDKGVGAGQKFAQEHNVHMFNLASYENRRLRETQYQTAVEDAKKAGLHPLFALGKGAYSAAPSVSGAGIGPRPAPASQSSQRGYMGVSKGAERRAEESHQMDMAIARQRIKANDIELIAANSQAARLTAELQNSPTMAQAYSDRLVEEQKQREVQREWNRQARIRTPKGLTVYGPQGGQHAVPAGVTPQSVLEDIIGESSEGHGVATAARMYLTDHQRDLMVKRIANQVRRAKAANLARKRRNEPPGWKRLWNRYKEWRK